MAIMIPSTGKASTAFSYMLVIVFLFMAKRPFDNLPKYTLYIITQNTGNNKGVGGFFACVLRFVPPGLRQFPQK